LAYFNERARYANRRVLRQYGIENKVTGEELMMLYELDHSCTECRIDLKPAEIEFDHITSITSLKNGGEHHISNINIKCRSCNRRKGVK
jgi:5-methylcytosine-specific restriction endonuclease McrA